MISEIGALIPLVSVSRNSLGTQLPHHEARVDPSPLKSLRERGRGGSRNKSLRWAETWRQPGMQSGRGKGQGQKGPQKRERSMERGQGRNPACAHMNLMESKIRIHRKLPVAVLKL
jgi:hypothetical protein